MYYCNAHNKFACIPQAVIISFFIAEMPIQGCCNEFTCIPQAIISSSALCPGMGWARDPAESLSRPLGPGPKGPSSALWIN